MSTISPNWITVLRYYHIRPVVLSVKTAGFFLSTTHTWLPGFRAGSSQCIDDLLNYFSKMRGYPQFSFWIPRVLTKTYFLRIVLNRAKISLH